MPKPPTNTIPDRPIERINKIERYVPNRVVAHLLQMSIVRGAIDLSGLWAVYNMGIFSASEMKEFYQIIGTSLTRYRSVFNETFEAESRKPHTAVKTKQKDVDEIVEGTTRPKKGASKPKEEVKSEPLPDEDPDRLKAMARRRAGLTEY